MSWYSTAKDWLVAQKDRLAEKMPWITAGRVLAAGYAVLILGIAFCVISEGGGEAHYRATRYLGPNTRLADQLLVPPGTVPLWLARERDQLSGKYVKEPVARDQKVTLANVVGWPNLNGAEAVPVEFDTQPDWMVLNQDATVEVWVGDELKARHVLVLAIVPSGQKWLALLRKSDLASNSLGASKGKITLRIEALPRELPEDIPQPPPPAQKPQSPEGQSPPAGSFWPEIGLSP